jgi:hypothetical protein
MIIFFISVKKVVKDTSKRLNLIDRLKFRHFFVLIKLLLVLTDVPTAIRIIVPDQISANCVSLCAFSSFRASFGGLVKSFRSLSSRGIERVCVYPAGRYRLSASVNVDALVACGHEFCGIFDLTRQLLDRCRDANLKTFFEYDRKNDEENSHTTDKETQKPPEAIFYFLVKHIAHFIL